MIKNIEIVYDNKESILKSTDDLAKHLSKGIYINFIKTDHLLLTPIFKQSEDDLAINKLQDLFPKHALTPIYCNELAKEGGLLHCVSWQG